MQIKVQMSGCPASWAAEEDEGSSDTGIARVNATVDNDRFTVVDSDRHTTPEPDSSPSSATATFAALKGHPSAPF